MSEQDKMLQLAVQVLTMVVNNNNYSLCSVMEVYAHLAVRHGKKSAIMSQLTKTNTHFYAQNKPTKKCSSLTVQI